MENINNIAIKISENSDRVKRCINDDDFLCEVLNSIEHKKLKEYYNSEKDGPIVDVRKRVCEELLLRSINKEKLNEIVGESKSKNPNAFRSWTNNFNILNSILADEFHFDVTELVNFFVEKFDRKVKTKIWDFKGPRNQGQDHYCILFYNDNQESHSTSLQFFIDFISSDKIKYGVWNESERIYLNGYFFTESLKFQSVIDYIDNIKLLILDDIPVKSEIKNDNYTFISSAIKILKDFENLPMSAKEIWSEIEKQGIYKTDGKTPVASLNTIMSGHSINSNNSNKSKKMYFECVGDKPIKYKLINYMPKRVKESLLNEGFITMEQLKEILEKNNIKIEL